MSDSDQHKYYRPYISDNDSDSESRSGSKSSSSSTDSDVWSFTEDQRPRTVGADFQSLARNLNKPLLDSISGPSILSQGVSEIYTKLGNTLLPDSIKNDKANVNTIFNVEATKKTSILNVDSKNRDKKIFTQPSYCVLHFPKLYRNIVSITFAEIKLLTSIYFFSKTNGNTDISIYEKDRTDIDINGKLKSTIVKTYINDGSYNITDLVSELQKQLNKVPLFLDYINGFNDFVNGFISSGDLSIVFNQPGDYYYDVSSKTYIANPTIETITSYFWVDRYSGLTSYSIDNLLIAYYYPVLKYYYLNDLSGDIDLSSGLGIDQSITNNTDVYNRILYVFEGLNDPVIFSIIKINKSFLDKYRLQHTFRCYLVNKYLVTINTQTQFISISSSGLNTSLSNLINLQQVKYQNQALSNLNIGPGDLNNLILSNTKASAIIQGMFSFYQTQFIDYFAVPWNQYSLSYYMNTNNPILLRNGEDVINIPTNSIDSYTSGIVTQSNTIINYQSTVSYWPSFSNITNTVEFLNLSNTKSSFNNVYIPSKNSINSNIRFITSSNILYSQNLTNSANVVCPIKAGKYTVIKFISPVRQTLEIETLPIPTAYSIPEYNKTNYDSTVNKYFNMPYIFTSTLPYLADQSYTNIYDTIKSNNLIQVPGWSNNSSWGLSYISSLTYYNYTANRLNITNTNGSLYYTFNTPVSTLLNSTFTYDLNLTFNFHQEINNISTLINTPTDFTAFVYHDTAAFMGDTNGNKTRSENPYFYKYSLNIPANTQSNTLQITTYPNQTYYVALRPNLLNGYPTCFITLVPWFNSSIHINTISLDLDPIPPEIRLSNFSTLIKTNFNYARVYDSNWIKLPINPSLFNTQIRSKFQLITSNLPMGRDTNGVSTDLIDYIPYVVNSLNDSFNPSINLGIDPINYYLFQSNSPYIGAYIYPSGDNLIMTPAIQQQYKPTTVVNHEYKIVHYYSPTYLSESILNISYFNSNYIYDTPAQLPFTLSTTQGIPIPGYSYAGFNSTIQFDRGVIGFSFIPGKGTWNLKRLLFRSAIIDYNNDPNQYIYYLGVYLLGDIINVNTKNINLNNALVVLSNSSRVTYTSSFSEYTNGFDVKGGTYYDFIKDSSFSNVNLLGFSQTPGSMVNQPESIYVCIAFTSLGIVNTINSLSGSAVPYPYYNTPYVSTSYLDGTSSYISGKGVIFPSTLTEIEWPSQLANINSFSPTKDSTQSQYVNSYPIGTSVVLYKKYSNILVNNNFLNPWTIPFKPTTLCATVKGYMLIQNTQINIYSYNQYVITYQFTKSIWDFSIDDIFSSSEFTSLEAISGNDYYFYFLGVMNKGSSTLRIKQFNPLTGEMSEIGLPTYQLPPNGIVRSFTVNNFNQLVFIYQVGNTTTFYYTIKDFTKNTILSQSVQSYTATHTMSSDSLTVFWLKQDANNLGNTVYEWKLGTNFPGISWTCSDPTLVWNEIEMTTYNNIPDINDRIFLRANNTIYYTTSWSNNKFTLDIINKPSFTVQELYVGYSGSIWVIDQNDLIIWGNRNHQIDVPSEIEAAWQIFYPFQRITLEKIDNDYNPITDLKNISYPNYPHTQLFYYDNTNLFNTDIQNSWGLESNALYSDKKFNGYYFNSYIEPFSVSKSQNNNDFKYFVIRGYTPTENSEVLLRFVIPNKYTFGYVSNNNLINEIKQTSNIDMDYSRVLSNFNKSFNIDKVFGINSVPNFNGQQIVTVDYKNFYQELSTLYDQYNTVNRIIDLVNSYVNTNILQYISTQLVNILPVSALKRQTFYSPLIFSILWNSSLLPQYKNLIDSWGLGFNLGFTKKDSPFSLLHLSTSFYKILEDYLYLRLSPEYSINSLDTTSSEDLSLTRESRGSVNEYYGKLLLGDFNTYSRTFVSNQVTFNPPIAKLDKLSFEWITSSGLRLNNNDCEWSASLAITEYATIQTLDSVIISPKIQDAGTVAPAQTTAVVVSATSEGK